MTCAYFPEVQHGGSSYHRCIGRCDAKVNVVDVEGGDTAAGTVSKQVARGEGDGDGGEEVLDDTW